MLTWGQVAYYIIVCVHQHILYNNVLSITIFRAWSRLFRKHTPSKILMPQPVFEISIAYKKKHVFDFYCDSTDWLPCDARSVCGDSWNRLQIVLHVFICVCIYKCAYMYVPVSVDMCYMYVCMCMCICVCVYLSYFYVASSQGFFQYVSL